MEEEKEYRDNMLLYFVTLLIDFPNSLSEKLIC